MTSWLDITGNKYGRLIAISVVNRGSKEKEKWLFVCDCGNEHIGCKSNAVSGKLRSCGCLRSETARRTAVVFKPGRFHGKHETTFINGLYCRYRSDARKRGISFLMSVSKFEEIIKEPCVYCGSKNKNVWTNSSTKESFGYTGIDRKDSFIGYTDLNVVPCCKICNYAKKQLSVDEFFEWVNRVYKHSGLGKTETFVELTNAQKLEI